MRVIARIISRILSATKPGIGNQGAPHRARFELDEAVAERARQDVADLLASYPLYPEIDVDSFNKAAP